MSTLSPGFWIDSNLYQNYRVISNLLMSIFRKDTVSGFPTVFLVGTWKINDEFKAPSNCLIYYFGRVCRYYG